MDNNTSHIMPNENNVPQVVFTKWPLDMDDDEFRAGYPFTSTQLEELNEQETWCDVHLSGYNDGVMQLFNPQNNDFNKTRKEDDKLSNSSLAEENEFRKIDVFFSETHANGSNNYNVTMNPQKQSHEEEQTEHDCSDIVKTGSDNGKQNTEIDSTN